MENTQEIKAFEVGKIYEMERPSDSMIAVKFAVVKRSAKFVTVKRIGTRKAMKAASWFAFTTIVKASIRMVTRLFSRDAITNQ